MKEDALGAATALRAPIFRRLRTLARDWTADHVDRPVMGAALLGSALRSGRTDVLFLGESSLLHVSPADRDLRRLGEMLAAESGLRVSAFYGPGYSASLFEHVVRLATAYDRPRCVVVSIVLRNGTHMHVAEHPVFGYRHARSVLASAERLGPGLLRSARGSRPSEEEYARFEQLTRKSRWGGSRTIGEYRRDLRGFYAPRESDERQALIFDYFHGEYSAGSEGLEDWCRLGQRLRDFGAPVFAYRAQMPVENGRRLLGPGFEEHVEENFRLVEESLRSGLGEVEFVEIGSLPDSSFVHAGDATEHLNEKGRRTVATTLAGAMRRSLD